MTSPSSDQSEAMQILGADAWARFDVWSLRAWEAAQRAADIAADNVNITSSNDDLDHRIVALFHATSVAKEFAEMVNPVSAVSCLEHNKGNGAVGAEAPGPNVLIITNEEE